MPKLGCKVIPWSPSTACKYVVVLSRFQNRILLSRHKDRSTWETQGGHIEPGESPEDAARRELWEESGAADFTLTPLCHYHAWLLEPEEDPGAWGAVFFADIKELGPLPESEMAEVKAFDALPASLTYPDITPRLFHRAAERFAPGAVPPIKQEEGMKVKVFINPTAGKQAVLQELAPIYEAFAAAGEQASLELTMSPQHAREALARAVGEERQDAVVCCGGDGTLSAAVNELLACGAKTPLGYIPAGTTNDFASFLGLPKEPRRAAQLIAWGQPSPIDIGRFDDRYFVYVASFGAFTQSSYSATQSLKNSLGHLAYIIEGIKELPVLKSYPVRVETAEGAVYEGDYLFGSMSNSTSLGGVIKLDGALVDPTDGRFELSLVKRPKSLHELNRILLSLMSGKADEELITFVHTAGAAFTCGEAMPWSLDGEYARGGESVKVEVLPGALRLFR